MGASTCGCWPGSRYLGRMNFDDILKLIAALGLGSVGGTIAGSISGGISAVWTARRDKRRQLDDTRRERLAVWRLELRDPERRQAHITTLPSWSEMRIALPREMVDDIEKPKAPIVVGSSPAMTLMAVSQVGRPTVVNHRLRPWDTVLDQLAALERTWGLI